MIAFCKVFAGAYENLSSIVLSLGAQVWSNSTFSKQITHVVGKLVFFGLLGKVTVEPGLWPLFALLTCRWVVSPDW